MNVLKGKITGIRTEGQISLLEIQIGTITFKAIVIDTPESVPRLKAGTMVKVLFKENEVIIGKGDIGRVSIQNRLPCLIKKVERGKLLAKVVLDFRGEEVVSLITEAATRQLELREEEAVWAMIKTNEVSISFYDEH